MMDFSRELNPAQLEAVRQTEGPLIIFAGAGSGKTRVLTYRIAALIENGVSPFSILAVTFTNRASAEMKERVEQLVGAAAHKVWISTFHSLAVQILRREAPYLPFDGDFVIYDAADQQTVIKHCIQELNVDDRKFRPRGVLAEISTLKNELVSPHEYRQLASNIREETIARLYELYQQKLLQQNALDFDDLLVQLVKLFRSEPSVLEKYRERFRYVMVDEYQDTNHVQYVLIHQLAGKHRNLCVVGDDDQSIYGWRGADIRNILDFEKDYPEAKVIKLEQNYRSTQRILAVANAVIANNRGRKPKELWTSNAVGDPIYFYQAFDERDEAQFVVETVQELVEKGEADFRDCAVFYRTNAQSRSFEEECIRANLPYRIFGGLRFYERKEIKDILAYLRLIANPADEVSLRRIINLPRRGIGETTIKRAEEVALQEGTSLALILREPEQVPDLGGRAVNAICDFFEMVDGWGRLNGVVPLAELVERVLDESGYFSMLESENSTEAETRLENLQEFLGVARQYEAGADDRSLAGFLEHLALVTDIDNYQPEENALVLMTIHGAKGMEFPVVFLTGMEEGLFPHARSMNEERDVEEERRLCYVGITRARERLYLSWAIRRFIYGSATSREPSRFLTEIPQEFLYPVVVGGAEAAAEETSLGSQEAAVAVADQDVSFQVGDRVEHKKFGRGVVMETQTGPGGDLEIFVSFESAGFKQLMAKYAPIKKV
jgi:DNA helicase-2/ATP-dependent DNA helicase PcrA